MRHINLAVGLFVVTVLATIITSVGYLLKAKGAFDEHYPYDFYTESAQSFEVGMPILFSGFQVGVIDKIALTDKGKVHIDFSVNEKNRRWLTQNSTLTLKKPLIGSPYIELHAQMGAPLLPANSTLPMTVSDDINDIITKLEPTVNRLIAIVKDLHIITQSLANKDGALMKSMNHIEIFSQKLAESDSLLTAMTGTPKTSKAMIDSVMKIKQLVFSAEGTLKNVDQLVKGMQGKVVNPSGQILEKVDLILKDITSKLNRLQGAVDAIGDSDKDIVKMREQILISIERSHRLIDQVDSILNKPKSGSLELP